MKKKFNSFFARCNSCNRFFRASSTYHGSCRTCRAEYEMTVFFEWLDRKLV